VVRLDCFKPENYLEEVNKLGYIFDKEEEAEDFFEFYEGYSNDIKESVEEIPEDKKQESTLKVLVNPTRSAEREPPHIKLSRRQVARTSSVTFLVIKL
jgi:hypothetical protein